MSDAGLWSSLVIANVWYASSFLATNIYMWMLGFAWMMLALALFFWRFK